MNFSWSVVEVAALVVVEDGVHYFFGRVVGWVGVLDEIKAILKLKLKLKIELTLAKVYELAKLQCFVIVVNIGRQKSKRLTIQKLRDVQQERKETSFYK